MTDIVKEIQTLQDRVEELESENEELKEELSSTETGEMLTSKIPFKIGKKYLIRTVTYFVTGKVKKIAGGFLVLEEGAWIPDTGRFNEAINKGTLNEVEPVDVHIYLNLNSITDAYDWTHKLPRDVK